MELRSSSHKWVIIHKERWCTSFPSSPKLCKIYTCFQVAQASDIQELKWEIILNTPPPPDGKTLHLLQNYSSKAVLTSSDKNLECFASQIGFSSPGTFLSKLSATCKWGTVVLSLKKAHKNPLQTFIKAWSLLMKIIKGFIYGIRMRKCYDDMWWNNCSPRKYRSLILVKLETETQVWWPDDISSRFIFSYFTVILLYNIWKIHAYSGLQDKNTYPHYSCPFKIVFKNAWSKFLCLLFRLKIWQPQCHNLTDCHQKYVHFMTIQESICINIVWKCSESHSCPLALVIL